MCVLYAAVDGLAGWETEMHEDCAGPHLAVMFSRSEIVGRETGFKVRGMLVRVKNLENMTKWALECMRYITFFEPFIVVYLRYKNQQNTHFLY